MFVSHTQLHVFDTSTINVQCYRDEDLEAYMKLFWGFVCQDLKFVDDMNWPSRSPENNPVEHVWDSLERVVAERKTIPSIRKKYPSESNKNGTCA